MNSTKKDLKKWISDLEELANVKAVAQGRYEQALESLKALGYESIEEAEAAVVKMEEERDRLKAEAEELMAEFKQKYADYISMD